MQAYLNKCHPNLFENGPCNVFLDTLKRLTVEVTSLRCELGQQANLLFIGNLFLHEDLLRLSKHNVDKTLDSLPAQVGGGCVKKVLVDISKHASGRLEVVVGGLEGRLLGSVLEGSMARQDS